MSSVATGSPSTSRGAVDVFGADRELGSTMPAERRAAAQRVGVAPILRVERGPWNAGDEAHLAEGGYGFLVLDGLLVRRVGIDQRFGAELLGPGDLLRPLEHDGEDATLPFEATWRVVSPVRIAVLDRRWSFRMGASPEVGIELAARAMVRSRRLANVLAIGQHPKLEVRLLLLLWELADRFGTVGPDGVRLRLGISQEVVSHLAGARRPSVSAALMRLSSAGRITPCKPGWLLHGPPPEVDAVGGGDVDGPLDGAFEMALLRGGS